MWFVQRLHIVGTVVLVIGFLQVGMANLFLGKLRSYAHFPLFIIRQLFGLISSMLLFCTVKHKRSSKTYKSYSPTVDTTLNRNGTSATYMDD